MRGENLYIWFTVSSHVTKEQYSALREMAICAFGTTICVVLCKYQTLYYPSNAPIVRVCSSLYMSAFIYSELLTRTTGQNMLS